MESSKRELLERKFADAQRIVREAFEKYGVENTSIAWTGGKDSTLVLYLIKTVCDADGIALPQSFCIDEGDMFDEVRDFIDRLCRDWGVTFELIHNDDVSAAAGGKLGAEVQVEKLNERNRREIERLGYDEPSFPFEPESFVGNHLMKTATLNEYLYRTGIAGFFEGIRWDEQASRANEIPFSPRDKTEFNPAHTRIYPILHFTERDVWDANSLWGIPVCSLYEKGYRSLGARVSTTKNSEVPAWEQDLENTYERGGRRQDKEELMEKLRKLGYM